MVKKERKKRSSLPKQVDPTSEGHCPYCHKPVKSLEHHLRAKHKGEKTVKK